MWPSHGTLACLAVADGVDPTGQAPYEERTRARGVGRVAHQRKGTRMDVRRTGRIFGWLFIGTFVTSIPARLLFIDGVGASWSDMGFIPGNASNASLKWGAVLEFGLIVTQIGTAVVIYPLLRRQSETVSLGYV